jgi:hypothetical protein
MKRKGFTIVLVMAVLGLAAAAMLVLGNVSDSLILDGSLRLAQARQRDLAASAIAWARHNRSQSADELAKGVDLDPAFLAGQQLRVRLTGDGQAEVTIQTRAGRLNVNSTKLLPLAGGDRP